MKIILTFLFVYFLSIHNALCDIKMDGKTFKNCQEVSEYCSSEEQEGNVCCGFGTGCGIEKYLGSVITLCAQVNNTDNCGGFNGWRKYKKALKNNKKIVACYIDTPNLFLYQKSLVEPKIKIEKCKVDNKNAECCKVVSGKWEIITGKSQSCYVENYSYKTSANVENIVVKHIIHPTFMSYTMEHCDKKDDYYNFFDNLAIFDKDFYDGRTTYGSHYCFCNGDEKYCKLEKEVCKKLSKYFNDKNICNDEIKMVTSDIIYE